jgi:hypothetical protein
MTTVEAILYARAGNEVYQRGAMRDEEKESLMIALYKQQAEEMEANGEWATLAKVAKACKVSAAVSVRQRTLSGSMCSVWWKTCGIKSDIVNNVLPLYSKWRQRYGGRLPSGKQLAEALNEVKTEYYHEWRKQYKRYLLDCAAVFL